MGAVVWISFYFLDFPYASILAVIAGATNLIPYVGPVIGAVPGLLVAVLNQDSSGTIALVGAIYVFAQAVDILFYHPSSGGKNSGFTSRNGCYRYYCREPNYGGFRDDYLSPRGQYY